MTTIHDEYRKGHLGFSELEAHQTSDVSWNAKKISCSQHRAFGLGFMHGRNLCNHTRMGRTAQQPRHDLYMVPEYLVRCPGTWYLTLAWSECSFVGPQGTWYILVLTVYVRRNLHKTRRTEHKNRFQKSILLLGRKFSTTVVNNARSIRGMLILSRGPTKSRWDFAVSKRWLLLQRGKILVSPREKTENRFFWPKNAILRIFR